MAPASRAVPSFLGAMMIVYFDFLCSYELFVGVFFCFLFFFQWIYLIDR